MKVDRCLRAILAGSLLAAPPAGAARAQDPPAEAREKQKRRDRQVRESLGWYRVTAGPDAGAAMTARPVLRWTNATRGQEGEPTLVLWTDAGRPGALASVYPWSTLLVFESVSLAREAGLTARDGGRTVWAPASVGVTFRDVPGAPAPAEGPPARLGQIKEIAGRFRVTMTGMKDDLSDREEMRLLPRPIYRYELAEARVAHPDLVDGAVFAFVQGTDPEAVLIVEAVRRGDRAAWQYALGRATSAGLEARLGPSVVWTAPRQTAWSDPKLPAIALGRPLVD